MAKPQLRPRTVRHRTSQVTVALFAKQTRLRPVNTMQDLSPKSSHRRPLKPFSVWKNLSSLLPASRRSSLVPSHASIQLSTALTKEQESKIETLIHYLLEYIGVRSEHHQVQELLERNDWELKKAIEEVRDLLDADEGLLVAFDREKTMLGAENDEYTSCYIDSLLFAMFVPFSTFEPLLLSSSANLDARRLQTSIRLFINRLRSGKVVTARTVRQLREDLARCGWKGRDSRSGNFSQEDTSELFLFLTDLFQLPYLPFQIKLFHGANADNDDDRLMTERMVTLSIPAPTDTTSSKKPPSQRAISLEAILVEHFYNNMITGIKRHVATEGNAEGSRKAKDKGEDDINEKMPSAEESSDHLSEKRSLPTDTAEIAVSAWQVLELLPFYSGTNEQGDRVQQHTHEFPDRQMILPLVLKRYAYDAYGKASRIHRDVFVPHEINISKFVSNRDGGEVCEVCGNPLRYVMELRSVVCHKGESPNAGHYIAYCSVPGKDDGGSWLKLDDLDIASRVTKFSRLNDTTAVFSEFARNGYMLFYELRAPCTHDTPEEEAAADTDYVMAAKLQALELTGKDGRSYSCSIQ